MFMTRIKEGTMINSDEEYMYAYIFVVTKNIIGWEPYFDILIVLIIGYA